MLKKTPAGICYFNQNIIQICCPFCDTVSTLTVVSVPRVDILNARGLKEFVSGHACDHCNKAIPLVWHVVGIDSGGIHVGLVTEVILAREPFNFAHLPEAVKSDVQEVLACLSVKSYNGFAAMCRRTIQSTCRALGAGGSTRVEKQLNELRELASLDEETFSALKEIMLGGHDGAHPQLPPVDEERSVLLLQLLRDVMFQLFTRPGLIKKAATKRTEAIQKKTGV